MLGARAMRWSLGLLVSSMVAGALVPAASASASENGAPAEPGSYIVRTARPDAFPLVARKTAAPIVVSASDYPGVVRVVNDLQADVERVTGVRPAVSTD